MKKYYSGLIILNDVDRLEYRSAGGETIEIFDIAVNSEKRKGIGTKLIDELINEVEQIGCERITAITHSCNDTAQKFYESNGFVGTLLPNFYKVFSPYPTGDAIMYIKCVE
jgi:ribosomal protein S18 acetylase RimI-like enzyme